MRLHFLLYPVLFTSTSAVGAVQEFTNKAAWQSAVGNNYTTLDFTGFEKGTPIVDQYASLGAMFTDGIDVTNNLGSFLNDGWGLNGAFDEITVEFAQPMMTIAADFPGLLKFTLLNDGVPFYVSSDFGLAGPSIGAFGGLISTIPFDSVVIQEPTSGLFIDDLYFGPPIPAPGPLVLFILATLSRPRRKRP